MTLFCVVQLWAQLKRISHRIYLIKSGVKLFSQPPGLLLPCLLEAMRCRLLGHYELVHHKPAEPPLTVAAVLKAARSSLGVDEVTLSI